jgi:hypothetical protein
MKERNYKEKVCKKRNCKTVFKPTAGNQVYCDAHKQNKNSVEITTEEANQVPMLSRLAFSRHKIDCPKTRSDIYKTIRHEVSYEVLSILLRYFDTVD